MYAWFAGAFERCLELCDAVHSHDAASRVHVALLKARALLRLDRPADALDVLRDAAGIPAGHDESITLRMLTGTAHVRNGQVVHGLDILLAAQHDGTKAHHTIRSEIALDIANAYYARREFDAAERALTLVDARSDIVSARALEHRGWIAMARTDGETAVTMFAAALEALDRCRQYDRVLEANCIRALAHLAVERLDGATWTLVEERRARMDWSASGLAQPSFWITYCAATYALDAQGNPAKAAREARAAEQIAPRPAYRVQARCKRSTIARCAGEPISERDHVESASELYGTLSASELSGDEVIVPLVLAEALANASCADQARSALDAFLKSSRKSPILSMTHSPTTFAYQRLVEGAVCEAAGERRMAVKRYREAFERYAQIGYKRRAILAALCLIRLNRDQAALAYAQAESRKLPPQSWLRREVENAKADALKLTAVQREVLALICRGKSNPEIARSRKRSLHTIRNLVSRLFEVFDVSSREQLAVECVRRGLYTPG